MQRAKQQPTLTVRRPGGFASSIFVRIGTWFEASATGWGILALPLIVLLVLAVSLLRLILTS